MIPERLAKLRTEMEKRKIDAYIVPTADFHGSEYVGEHFMARRYMTGFTGSAGTAVITRGDAGLWTDARYFLQAAKQLEGTTVTLYRMGEEGVPTLTEYLRRVLGEGACIGFDGRTVSESLARTLREIAAEKHGSVCVDEDLVGLIWTDRPPMSCAPVKILRHCYTGRGTREKLADIREAMRKEGAQYHLIASLYDIAWILNVRGDDIRYVPVVLSFLAVTEESCIWFVQPGALDDTLRGYLAERGVETRAYEDVYAYAASIPEGAAVLLDGGSVNSRLRSALRDGVRVIDRPNPSVLMKAVKNTTELENTRRAHLKDAVSMCRFMYWLKTNAGKIPMTELSVDEKLGEICAEQEGYLEQSFGTICGYKEHGAIIHYSATPGSDVPVGAEGLLLVDSGRQYLEGTTDITRTFALGPVSDKMKRDFTRIVRSNLALSSAVFLHGCTGMNLDVLARMPLWEDCLDYKHGTGHGVGHVLNVHEGPNGFRWKQSPDRSEGSVLEEGMITTDEPGIYLEGEYGIRLENEMICRKGVKNEYGQFMYFEVITWVPFDLDAVLPEELSPAEKRRLNAYHAEVYRKVSPYLSAEEAEWLRHATRAV